MTLHRHGTQPRLIDSSEHSSINLNLRKRNSIYNLTPKGSLSEKGKLFVRSIFFGTTVSGHFRAHHQNARLGLMETQHAQGDASAYEGEAAGAVELASEEADNPIMISISGTIFALDAVTVTAIGSPLLTTILNPNSGFKAPVDNLHHAVADPEGFSCIVHLARYGILPEMDERKLLQTADYWGVKEAIERELAASRTKVTQLAKHRLTSAINSSSVERHFNEAVRKKITIEKAKVHHNERYADGAGRIYCKVDNCHNRDFDSRWFEAFDKAKHYTSCIGCDKDVLYKVV